MKLKCFQIDAFTNKLFAGNPAGVVPMETPTPAADKSDTPTPWPEDAWLQSVAAENNLAETAFFRRADGGSPQDFDLRWLTPTVEVDLCGHATLSAAHVLFAHLNFAGDRIIFDSRSGPLSVTRRGTGYELDFPATIPERSLEEESMQAAIGVNIREAWTSPRDLLLLVDSESTVRDIKPDMAAIGALDREAVIVTAPGDDEEVDFVSRFFAPKLGVPEDPVTGSAHCVLTPFWSARLDKTTMSARQISARGGAIDVTYDQPRGRVLLRGDAITYLEGEIPGPA